MRKAKIKVNPENGVALSWQLDADDNRLALLIERGSYSYRLLLSKHPRAYLSNIGFKSAAGFPATIELPTGMALPKFKGDRTHTTVGRWVDTNIIQLCGGTKFIKSLGIDVYSQLLNDPTHSLSIKRSSQTWHDHTRTVNIRSHYNEKLGHWQLSDLNIDGHTYRFGHYRTRMHARATATAALKAYNKSTARFKQWYNKHCTDKHLGQLRVGDTSVHLSEKVHGAEAIKAFDASHATDLQQAAQQLRRLRGGAYIGVESRKRSDGRSEYRAKIQINGLKWLSRFVATAEQAARLHDTTYRQLFAISKRLQPNLLNKLNFFDAEMVATQPLQGSAREELLAKSEPFNKVIHQSTHGAIRFDAKHRKFSVAARHHETHHMMPLGFFATEADAVAAFDQAMTQMHKDKAASLRFGHYPDKQIAQWQAQAFSLKGIVRIKRNHKHHGINEVYAGDTLIGYRGIVVLDSGRELQTRAYRFDEETDRAAARFEAEEGFDCLLASTAKALDKVINYNSHTAETRDTLHRHDDEWWHGTEAYKPTEYSSPYHGISKQGRRSGERWLYQLIYTTTNGQTHKIAGHSFPSEVSATKVYDKILRRLLTNKKITLTYFLHRINKPALHDIVLAKFLNLASVGHGDHSVELKDIDNGLFEVAYDEGEVTATLHYKNTIGVDKYIGVYARMQTAVFDNCDDAHASATKLMQEHSINLSADDLDATRLTELLGNDQIFKPADYKLTQSMLNVRLLSEFGLRGRDNPGQGNCLFHAFARQLELLNVRKADGTAYSHADCRQIAVNAMIANIDHYRPFIIGQADDFVWHMAQNGVWADHLPLQALARHFNIDVVITHSESNPANGLAQTTVFRQNAITNPAHTIMLGYIDQVHYVSAEEPAGAFAALTQVTAAQRIERIRACVEAQAIDAFNAGADMDEPVAILPVAAAAAPQPTSVSTAAELVTTRPATSSASTKHSYRADFIAEPDHVPDAKSPCSDELEAPHPSKRMRTSSPQPSAVMPSLFSAHRHSAYAVEFPDRVADNSSIDAVCSRLSGLVHYCLASPAFNERFHPALNAEQIKIKVARAINDVAAMIELNQADLCLSTRTTRLVATLLRKFAMDNRWDGDRAHNHSRIAGHDAYLATYRLTHDSTRTPRTVDEIFSGMFKEFLQGSEALYGDNSGFDASKLANLCYQSIKAQYVANPTALAACEAEFRASFGDDAIHWHGTREAPFAAPDLDMTRP